MHYHHLIAVEADSRDEAEERARDFLSRFEGPVWDWYEVGGRWSGALEDDDVLCAKGHEDRIVALVRSAIDSRRAEMRELRRLLGGPDGLEELYEPFGLGGRTEDAVARVETYQRESAALFNEMLTAANPEDPKFSMLGYVMRTLGGLLSDSYGIESMFYDTAAYTGQIEPLLQRILDAPERQWLVSVDLHH